MCCTSGLHLSRSLLLDWPNTTLTHVPHSCCSMAKVCAWSFLCQQQPVSDNMSGTSSYTQILSEVVCSVYTRKHIIAVQILIRKCNKCILCYGTTEEASRMLTPTAWIQVPDQTQQGLVSTIRLICCTYRICNCLLRGKAVNFAECQEATYCPGRHQTHTHIRTANVTNIAHRLTSIPSRFLILLTAFQMRPPTNAIK